MVCEVSRKKPIRVYKGVVINEADVIVLVIECPFANGFDLRTIRSVIVIATQKDFVRERFSQNVEFRVHTSLRVRAEPRAVEELVVGRTESLNPRRTLGVNTGLLVRVTKATLIQPVDCGIVKPVIESMARFHGNK